MLEVGLSPLSTAGLYLWAQQFLFSEKPMPPDEAADETEDLSTLNPTCRLESVTSVNCLALFQLWMCKVFLCECINITVYMSDAKHLQCKRFQDNSVINHNSICYWDSLLLPLAVVLHIYTKISMGVNQT